MKLKIRARETFVCPICAWRVTEGNDVHARIMFREHMKREHFIKSNNLKLLKAI